MTAILAYQNSRKSTPWGSDCDEDDVPPIEHTAPPALRLFTTNAGAWQNAASLGSSWSAFAYGGGYMLTTGWLFRDAIGTIEAFRPAPREVLKSLQDLVRVLQPGHYPRPNCLRLIEDYLRGFPVLRCQPRVQFEAICFCTLKRLDHPAPCDHPSDWLTLPSSTSQRICQNIRTPWQPSEFPA